MKREFNGRALDLILGDITDHSADAIANAANSGLRGGGGVDGAIHRAGGPDIMSECRGIGGCPTGSAVITGAGDLHARYVLHAVGPIWKGGGAGEAGFLADAYAKCLELASAKDLKSVAFPSISTGIYGYPVDQAASIALNTVKSHLRSETSLERVTFVLFDARTMNAYETALSAL